MSDTAKQRHPMLRWLGDKGGAWIAALIAALVLGKDIAPGSWVPLSDHQVSAERIKQNAQAIESLLTQKADSVVVEDLNDRLTKVENAQHMQYQQIIERLSTVETKIDALGARMDRNDRRQSN